MSAVKISSPMRWIYGACVAAIILALGYKALVVPQLAAARAKQEEIVRLRESLGEVRGRLARLESEARDPRVRAEIERLVSSDASPTEALRALLAQLSRRSAGAECEFHSLHTEPAVSTSQGDEVPFRARLVGRYASILDYLRELESSYPLVHVRSVAFTSLPEKGHAADAEIAGALYVIR